MKIMNVKKMIETMTVASNFHFLGIDKADVGKVIGNFNSSKIFY